MKSIYDDMSLESLRTLRNGLSKTAEKEKKKGLKMGEKGWHMRDGIAAQNAVDAIDLYIREKFGEQATSE